MTRAGGEHGGEHGGGPGGEHGGVHGGALAEVGDEPGDLDAAAWDAGPFGRTSPLGRAWHGAAARRRGFERDRRDAMLEMAAWLLLVTWWCVLVRNVVGLSGFSDLRLVTAVDLICSAIAESTGSMLLVFCVLLARRRRLGATRPLRLALRASAVLALTGALWLVTVVVRSIIDDRQTGPVFVVHVGTAALLIAVVNAAVAWTGGDMLDRSAA